MCNTSIAQNFYSVTHTSGTLSIGNTDVSVKAVDNPDVGYYCGAGPYRIGQNLPSSSVSYSGYEFTFSRAIHLARFQITASEKSEQISFVINGIPYALTAANLNNYTGSCGNNGNSRINADGELIFSFGGNNNTEVQIEDSITSILIKNIDSSAGSVFSFHFVTDTVVDIDECSDTLLCVGDTISVAYSISGTFAPGNVFSLEMSDKHGSFAIPTVLSTVNSTSRGVFKTAIPKVASGENYKLRVKSTDPVRMSEVSNYSLAIGNMPLSDAFNSGDVCEGETAMIWATIYATYNYTDVFWNGPGLTPDYPQRLHRFSTTKLSDSGMYIARVEDYGCATYDTTYLHVRPNPVSTIATANAIICTGDTLTLVSSIDTATALNVWLLPDGSRDTAATLMITPVTATDSGIYVLTTYLYGCSAQDTADVEVRKLPSAGIAINSPCVGDALTISATDTNAGVSYRWDGPGGFTTALRDTVIETALFDAGGRYILTVSRNGCTATDSVTATIKPRPYSPQATGDTLLCEGQNLHLNGVDTMVNTNTVYTWIGPDGFTSKIGKNILGNISMSASGQYIFSGDLDGCTASDTMNVVVKHTPFAPEISSNSPLLTGQTLHLKLDKPEPNVNYSWTGPQGFSSNIFNPDIEKITWVNAGTYIMTATLDGCGSSSITVVTVNDIADTTYLMLFPNPNNGNFTIKGLFKMDQQIPLRITNAIGQVVYTDAVVTDQKRINKVFDLKGRFASGVYTLRLLIDGKLQSLPFTIVRD